MMKKDQMCAIALMRKKKLKVLLKMVTMATSYTPWKWGVKK